jgi:hypothetical protein
MYQCMYIRLYDRVLRIAFVPKRNEGTEGWKKVAYNEDLHNLKVNFTSYCYDEQGRDM